MCSVPEKTVTINCAMNVFNICDVLICFCFLFSPTQLLRLFIAFRSVGEDITVMSAFNLLHLVTKSQPVALRACGLPSGSCRDKKNCKVVFSQQELRKRLTPLQYHVTQEKGTESAFEGEYTHHKDPGIYKCVVCGTPLFRSESKFDSGSGWPSFHDVISSDAITFTDDFSYGMHRVETSCSQCGAHLGHIFDDGPRPTGPGSSWRSWVQRKIRKQLNQKTKQKEKKKQNPNNSELSILDIFFQEL
uniref:Peptide-methionine (R)-S-oxide reductase n=1 Tax=Canis lupus familiaris TaxID=9615 RepID=A0A8C0TFR5_CANLF